MNPELAKLSAHQRETMDPAELEELRAKGDEQLKARQARREEQEATRKAIEELEKWKGGAGHPRYFLRREKASVGIALPSKTIDRAHRSGLEPARGLSPL